MKSIDDNLQLWEQRIKERVQNGLTVDEWCLQNEVTRYKYYYWNQRVRENHDQATNDQIIFADVTSSLSNLDNTKRNSADTADFQIFFKDIQVTVPSNFNSESLSGLMKVLQSL